MWPYFKKAPLTTNEKCGHTYKNTFGHKLKMWLYFVYTRQVNSGKGWSVYTKLELYIDI